MAQNNAAAAVSSVFRTPELKDKIVFTFLCLLIYRVGAHITAPGIDTVALIDFFYAEQEWAKLRRPGAVELVSKRLAGLSKALGDRPYLDGSRFTAGDLMMTTVLRILKHTDIVTSEKRLAAYVERCTSRPAFKRAFDAQIGDFRKAA